MYARKVGNYDSKLYYAKSSLILIVGILKLLLNWNKKNNNIFYGKNGNC